MLDKLRSIFASPSKDDSLATAQSGFVRQTPSLMRLEQRLMFDGAAVATTLDTFDHSTDSSLEPIADAVSADNAVPRTVIIVDASLSDIEAITASIPVGAVVITLEQDRDGWGQISEALSNQQDISSLHIFSHGSEGLLQLGSSRYTQQDLQSFGQELQNIGNALSSDADILLYGCSIGAGAEGQNFITTLASLTRADIAASDDATGGRALGGDWDLEAHRGDIESTPLHIDGLKTLLNAISITNADDQTYIEGDTIQVAPNISFNNGGFYDSGYLIIQADGTLYASETLALTSSSNPNDIGEISVSGSEVLIGEGGSTRVIGLISDDLDGTSGKALRIDFISPLPNGNFSNGLTDWAVDSNFAGFAWDTHSGSPTEHASVVTKDGRTALEMGITGTVTEPFGTAHGPVLTSSAFSATAGDYLTFDWKAAQGADLYDIYVYLRDANTNQTTQLLYDRGEFSEWTNITAVIPYTSDNLEFIFYGGSYDGTGGLFVDSTFWIDNVGVYSRTITDGMISKISRQVTYSNSDYTIATGTRALDFSVLSYNQISATGTVQLNTVAVDQTPQASSFETIATSEDTSRLFSEAMFTGVIIDLDDAPAYDSIRITSQPIHGALSVNGTTLSDGSYVRKADLDNLLYSPDANWHGTETFIWQAESNGLLSNEVTATINVISVNDAPLLTMSSGAVKPANDGSWFTVDEGLTLTDVDEGETGNDTITEYVVYIKNPEADDTLRLASNLHGVASTYNDATKLLKITSSAGITARQMQDVLRQVQIETTSGVSGNRTVIFTSALPDGASASNYVLLDAAGMSYKQAEAAAKNYMTGAYLAVPDSIEEYNTISTLVGSNAAYIGLAHYIGGTTSSETIYDATTYSITHSYAASGAEFQTYNGLSKTWSWASGYEFLGDQIYSGYQNTAGQITQMGSGGAVLHSSDLYAALYFTVDSLPQVQAAVNNHYIGYVAPGVVAPDNNGVPRGQFPYNGPTSTYGAWVEKTSTSSAYGSLITSGSAFGNNYWWYWNDPNGLDAKNYITNKYVVEYQTFSAPVTDPSDSLSGVRIVSINTSNAAPTISADANAGSTSEDQSLAIGASLFTASFSDGDSDALAAIEITNLPSNGGLSLNGVSVSANQVISLTELPHLIYTPDANYNGSESFQYKVNDGTAWSGSAATVNITVSPLNDAPTLNATSSTLTDIAEDLSTNNGEQISIFIDDADLSDLDGVITSAIAVTEVDNTHGNWQYSLDGSTWLDFSAAANQVVSLTSARLLDGSEYVRFVPASNYSGTSTFKYRPWDQTSGTSGDADATLFSSGSTHVGTRDADLGTATLAITPVNDRPVVLSGSNALIPITEDEITYNEFSVASFSASRITDADGTASSGVAITGTVAGNGNWKYSTDAGATWADMPSVSVGSALLLRSIDKVRFIPNEIEGTTATLSWVAWDQSTGTEGTQVDSASSGVDSAFSVDSVTTSLTVTDINDRVVITDPTTVSFDEDNSITFASSEAQSIVLSDVDETASTLHKMTLGVSHGKVKLAGLSGLTVLSGADNSGNIQVSGELADLNTALEGMVYTPDQDFNTTIDAETLSITVVDVGVTGSKSFTLTSNISMTISAVNDAPYIESTPPNAVPPLAVDYELDVAPFFGDVDSSPLTYTVTNLPPGLSYDPATHSIVGQPTTPGVYVVSIIAEDSDGAQSPALTYTLTVLAPDSIKAQSEPEPTPTDNKPFDDSSRSENIVIDSVSALMHRVEPAEFLSISPPAIVELAPMPFEHEFKVERAIPNQVFDDRAEYVHVIIPENTFYNSDAGAKITYKASMMDGKSLPDWLDFDAKKGEFKGKPPAGLDAELEIKVIAVDSNGKQAETTVKIQVKNRDKISTKQGAPGLDEQMQSQSLVAWKSQRDLMIAQAAALHGTAHQASA